MIKLFWRGRTSQVTNRARESVVTGIVAGGIFRAEVQHSRGQRTTLHQTHIISFCGQRYYGRAVAGRRDDACLIARPRRRHLLRRRLMNANFRGVGAGGRRQRRS